MMNESQYIQKAVQYNLLSDYYKYIDPAQHIRFYQKHLKYLNKAMAENQRNSQLKHTTYVRFMNATKDYPKIDIYTNGRLLIKELPYESVTPYYNLHNGKHHIDIYPAGTQVSTILNKNFNFDSNEVYSLITVGTKDKLQLLPYSDLPQNTTDSTKAIVKFIHLSTQFPSVDVISKNGTTLCENIGYKKSSEYKYVEPVESKLEIVNSGTREVLQSIESVPFSPAKSTTIFFTDSKVIIV